MKFKVGDEVKLGGGRAKVIHIESTGDFPYLVERADNRIEFCNDAELYPLLPAIPPGWTPASEPPDSNRNVRVTLNDGREWYGWYYEGGSEDVPAWLIIHDGEDMSRINADKLCDARDAAPGEVIAWREIEPAAAEPKPDAWVRYAIAYKDEVDSCDFEAENCYDTIDRAVDESKKYCRDENKPVEVWKLVAIVNPPAEPEVIRMEE